MTPVTPDQLRDAYRRMCLIRAFETRLNELFLQGIVAGTTHLSIGQEACAVGVCWALAPEDCLFSNHRGHGHLLARGADPGRVMAEIFGNPRGYAGGRGGSQHMAVKEINFLGTHGITAGTIPLAVGAALHKKRRREPGVAIVFFGDGAVGEGISYESFNLAQVWTLPVLFVCENNLYAMSTPHAKVSPVPDAAQRVAAHDMKRVVLDGNDVVAVARETGKCRQAIVAGSGPWFIELKTYRQCGHSRGDACEYRTREEEAAWRDKDPLSRARALLPDWTDAADARLQAEVTAEIARAEAFARDGGTSLNHA